MVTRARHPMQEVLGRALVELVRRPAARLGDPGPLDDDLFLHQLVQLATFHRLPGVVYRSLLDVGVEEDRLFGLRRACQMATVSHSRCLAELDRLADALDEAVPAWLVLKGPVLVELGYRDPGARLYEDLDLLVQPTDLAAALRAVERLGGRTTDLNWPRVTALQRAEIPMVLAAGMLADVHWHVLVTPNVRSRFSFPVDELFERRRRVVVGGSPVATLDGVDGLLYLCLHGSLSGGHQLVWLKDLDQMLVADPPDWDELVTRARRRQLGLVAAMQLDRARSVLGLPVPVDVIDELAGGALWWRLWRRRQQHVGLVRWGGSVGTGRMVTAATSRGTASSVAQLGRAVVDEVVRPRLATHRSRAGADAVPDLYRQVGGDAERDAYLSGVAGGRWR